MRKVVVIWLKMFLDFLFYGPNVIPLEASLLLDDLLHRSYVRLLEPLWLKMAAMLLVGFLPFKVLQYFLPQRMILRVRLLLLQPL